MLRRTTISSSSSRSFVVKANRDNVAARAPVGHIVRPFVLPPTFQVRRFATIDPPNNKTAEVSKKKVNDKKSSGTSSKSKETSEKNSSKSEAIVKGEKAPKMSIEQMQQETTKAFEKKQKDGKTK